MPLCYCSVFNWKVQLRTALTDSEQEELCVDLAQSCQLMTLWKLRKTLVQRNQHLSHPSDRFCLLCEQGLQLCRTQRVVKLPTSQFSQRKGSDPSVLHWCPGCRAGAEQH